MSFKLTILGSSSAIPTSERNTSAQMLNHDERFFLIDCGEGTQIQLRRFKLRLGKIDHIFISHLHGDHIFGLPGLLSSFDLMGRKKDLHVYGPPGLKNLLNNQFRLHKKEQGYSIIYQSLMPSEQQIIYEDKKLTVTAFPLVHNVPVWGFLFREKPRLRNIKKEVIDKYAIPVKDIVDIKNGADFVTDSQEVIKNNVLTIPPYKTRSYAYCTDTKYTASIIPVIKNIDLLYHESTFLQKDIELAAETQHSTALQAATIAKNAAVGKLIIGHFSTRYKQTKFFLDEARKVFTNTLLAEDGSTIKVELTRGKE